MKKITLGLSTLALITCSQLSFAAAQNYVVLGSSSLSAGEHTSGSGWITGSTNSDISGGIYDFNFNLNKTIDYGTGSDSINIVGQLSYNKNTDSGSINATSCTAPPTNDYICSMINIYHGPFEISSSPTENMGLITFNNDNPLQFTVDINHVTNFSALTLNFNLAEQCSEVPLPAGAWLFGSALLGLAGFKRKKK